MNLAWIALALATGVVLGMLHFGGLWVTVRGVASGRSPAWFLLVSFLLRAGFVLLGFYAVMDGRWERVAACLAGFVVSRTWLIRRLGSGGGEADGSATLGGRRSTAG